MLNETERTPTLELEASKEKYPTGREMLKELGADEDGWWEGVIEKVCNKLNIVNEDSSVEVTKSNTKDALLNGFGGGKQQGVHLRRDPERFEEVKKQIGDTVFNLGKSMKEPKEATLGHDFAAKDYQLSSLMGLIRGLDKLGLKLTDVFESIDPDFEEVVENRFWENNIKAAREFLKHPYAHGVYVKPSASYVGRVQRPYGRGVAETQAIFEYLKGAAGTDLMGELEKKYPLLTKELLEAIKDYGKFMFDELLLDNAEFNYNEREPEMKVEMLAYGSLGNGSLGGFLNNLATIGVEAEDVLGERLENLFTLVDKVGKEVPAEVTKEFFALLQRSIKLDYKAADVDPELSENPFGSIHMESDIVLENFCRNNGVIRPVQAVLKQKSPITRILPSVDTEKGKFTDWPEGLNKNWI